MRTAPLGGNRDLQLRCRDDKVRSSPDQKRSLHNPVLVVAIFRSMMICFPVCVVRPMNRIFTSLEDGDLTQCEAVSWRAGRDCKRRQSERNEGFAFAVAFHQKSFIFRPTPAFTRCRIHHHVVDNSSSRCGIFFSSHDACRSQRPCPFHGQSLHRARFVNLHPNPNHELDARHATCHVLSSVRANIRSHGVHVRRHLR